MIKFENATVKYTGIYRGQVLDYDDPDKLGRIKVNVFGIYNNISAEDLPWCVPMQMSGFGAGSGYGLFSVPKAGSIVFIMFEGGDVYQPICVGAAPDKIHGLPTDRTTNYPNRLVLKTFNGILIYIDDSNGEIKIEQPGGSYILMDSSGNISISGVTVSINP